MFTKKQILLNSITLLFLSVTSGVASAADTYTMAGDAANAPTACPNTGTPVFKTPSATGSFEFWNVAGANSADFDYDACTGVNHNDVIAVLDFTAGTGTLDTNTSFNGATWHADVGEMFFYDGVAGGTFQTFTYTWTDVQMWDGVNIFDIYNCRRSLKVNGCASQEALGWIDGTNTPASYTFNLSEGQFALGLFFDWTTNADIPVLAAFNITSIDASGNITATSIDTGDGADDGANGGTAGDGFLDGDGVKGTKMLVGPFPGQTPAFDGTFTVATNDAPITAVAAPLSTNEETLITLAKADFTESATVFPSRVYLPASKSLYIADGTGYTTNNTSSVTPSLNVDTSLTVPVGLTIGTNNSATFDSSISINAQNDAPIISSCSYPTSAAHSTAYSGTITAADPDTGDSIAAYSIASDNALPTNVTFSTVTGEISGTPDFADVGYVTTNIIVTATDTDGPASSSCTAFDLTVTGANVDPVLTGTPVTAINEDAAYSFTVSAVDVGDTLTYSISGNPAWMSISPTAAGQASGTVATISGTPTNAFVGTTGTITVTATDSVGATDTIQFTVTVSNTNDAPTIAAGTCVTASAEARSSYSCTPTADDVDVGDTPLTFSATGLPASGSLSIDSGTGTISGNTVDADVGTHNIVISVTDTGGPVTTSLASYALTITAYDQPPTATGALLSTPLDTVLNGTLTGLASDPESCGCLVYRKDPVPTATAHGSVVINANGSFAYTPTTGYNGTDSFDYIVNDGSTDSNTATVQIIVGTVSGETYASSNFTMFDDAGLNANGGTNDVIASWDGLYNANESDADFSHMTLSSITPYFGALWTAHHIRVFGPGTYTFDTTCTVAELEAGMGGPGNLCNNPLDAGQTQQFITMTVAAGQVGAHILFDWSVNLNIDVLNVWDTDSEFDISTNPGSGVLYNGPGYGPYSWSGAPAADTTWRLASTDNDGDGIPGIPMVDGAFIDFNANFNLDIVSTGSNFTMFDDAGLNANGGTNDVVAKWDGLYNTNESDADFSHMTLSTITPYFGALWTAHHIRVFGPGTYSFDTTCTVAELEAGMGGPGNLCNNPLDAGQTQQFITMTVAAGQVGAHILFDWSVNLNIDVLNVWDIDSEFDISTNPGSGVLYNGAGYGPYPWSGAPAANTSWRLASTDNDGDGVPGIPMVDGAFIDFNANFNLFVGSGSACVPTVINSFCGTIEVNVEVSDPDLGAGSTNIYSLIALYLMMLGSVFAYRRAN